MWFNTNRLAAKHLFYVVACSTFFALIITCVQIIIDYRKDIAEINEDLDMIDKSYIPSIISSRYNLDDEQLDLLLAGIQKLRDIEYVEITSEQEKGEKEVLISVGDAGSERDIIRKYPLIYRREAREINLGDLHVYATLKYVKSRLLDRIVVIIISNTLKTFLMSFFILWIYQVLTIRHLVKIADATAQMDLGTLDSKISLDRRPASKYKKDELDEIVDAINKMMDRIKSDMEKINLALETQRFLNKKIEDKNEKLITEIADRKRVEERLKETSEQLEAILVHSPLLIGEFDTEGRYLLANPALTKLFNLPPSEVVGGRFAEPPQADIGEIFLRNIPQVVEKPQAITVEDYLPETEQYFITTLFPLFDASGLIRSIGVIAHDITDHIRIETEKEKILVQLQQSRKMEAIGTLAGGISHDFNNLLQVINGYTQIMLLDKQENDPDYANLKAVYKAGQRASQLIRQLLLFSRKAEAEKKPIDLNHEVEQVRRILERTIPKMIDMEIHSGGRLRAVNADPVQIEQVLLNLGGNAADAMPDGGRLIIGTENADIEEEYAQSHMGVEPGKYVLLTFSDTGRGMDRKTIEHIFEPFFTTKKIGKGTGLGLASVYGIIKNHGGHITCDSEIGRGTTFKLYLPALVEQEAGYSEKDILESPPKGGTETILLVDDEDSVRDFASKVLKRFGYTVMTASTGEAALEIYTDGRGEIDLVIMDIGMPGMGGHKCLGEMLAINPDARALIASGYSINGQIKATMDSGAVGYVGKPYQVKDLLNKVRAALEGRREAGHI